MARELGEGKECLGRAFCRNALTPCWRTPAALVAAAQRRRRLQGGAATVRPRRQHAPMLSRGAAQATPPLLQPELLLSLLPASWILIRICVHCSREVAPLVGRDLECLLNANYIRARAEETTMVCCASKAQSMHARVKTYFRLRRRSIVKPASRWC